MGYRSCLALIRLAGQYSSSRMEAAAERALAQGNLSLPGAAESCADRGGIGGGRRQHRVQLARHDRARKELSPAALAEASAQGGDAQRQKRVDGIASTGVNRRAGACVAQRAGWGPDIPLEKTVVRWVFASDVAN